MSCLSVDELRERVDGLERMAECSIVPTRLGVYMTWCDDSTVSSIMLLLAVEVTYSEARIRRFC